MQTSYVGDLFPHDSLRRVRHDFRCFIREALANFVFISDGDFWRISEPATGAVWLGTSNGEQFTFELLREAL